MFRVEISKAFRRPRTYVLGGLLAGVAVLPAIILSTSNDAGGGPAFFDLVRHNGLFAALTALAFVQPFILPLGAGLLGGEIVAGEASAGTLRYLLVRPVGRVRLVLSKYGAVMALLAAAVLFVFLVGLVAGAIAFGLGPVPTLSGSTVSALSAGVRSMGVAAYIVAGIAGLAAMAAFFSTVTDSAPAATVATVAFVIVSQILDALSSLRVIHPYLLTHDWLAYVDLFRTPVAWDGLAHGLVVFSAYTAGFLMASLGLFTARDVTS